MRRALLVYSALSNWAFYMKDQPHLLKLVNANAVHACTRLTAGVNGGDTTIQFKDMNGTFGDTKISFSGDYMIIWDAFGETNS